MGGHDNKSIDTEPFVLVTVVETFSDDQTTFFGYKYRQPVNRCKGEIIKWRIIVDLEAFHFGCQFVSEQG